MTKIKIYIEHINRMHVYVCLYSKKKERRTTKLMSRMKQQIFLKKLGTKLCKKIIQEKKSLFRVMRQKEILTQLNVFKKKKKEINILDRQ
jgi:hypothetical protein